MKLIKHTMYLKYLTEIRILLTNTLHRQYDNFSSQYTYRATQKASQVVTAFHQSTQNDHGYPGTRLNTRAGTRVLKYPEIRALSWLALSYLFCRHPCPVLCPRQ